MDALQPEMKHNNSLSEPTRILCYANGKGSACRFLSIQNPTVRCIPERDPSCFLLILCALDKAADPLVEKERYKAHKYALNNIERCNEKDCKCSKIRY